MTNNLEKAQQHFDDFENYSYQDDIQIAIYYATMAIVEKLDKIIELLKENKQ